MSTSERDGARRIKTNGELLAWARSLGNPFQEVVSQERLWEVGKEAIDIPDGSYGITNASSPTRTKLATYGMSTCVAVSLHSPDSTTALAHFTTFNTAFDLMTVLEDMFPGESEEQIKARAGTISVTLRGGMHKYAASVQLACDLLRFIDDFGLHLVGADILEMEGEMTRGFAIDSADGRVIPGVVPQESAPAPVLPENPPYGTALFKSFDGRLAA